MAITPDPVEWLTTRVDALEAANGAAVEKIAAMDAEIARLTDWCVELEEVVHRLEDALRVQRAAFAVAALPGPHDEYAGEV